MQGTLFDTEPAPAAAEFVLWKREPVKGARWRIVGRAGTRLGALGLMDGSGEYRVEERGGHGARQSGSGANDEG